MNKFVNGISRIKSGIYENVNVNGVVFSVNDIVVYLSSKVSSLFLLIIIDFEDSLYSALPPVVLISKFVTLNNNETYIDGSAGVTISGGTVMVLITILPSLMRGLAFLQI